MVDLHRASEQALKHFSYNPGAFYGTAAGLSLGTGLLYQNVRYPIYDTEEELFDTVEGLAYILTHECDVDQANERHFNESLLICPIIDLGDFSQGFSKHQSEDALFGLLPAIASNRVFRVFYIPPIPNYVAQGVLPFGGLLYLNRLCNTHIGTFNSGAAQPLCALSQYAQRLLDFKLWNHFFREKSQILPMLI